MGQTSGRRSARLIAAAPASMTERTGIKERRWAGPGESTATLATARL